jgi:hypothetical protein
MLKPTQRYAAGALFGLALHQAQQHQTTHPLSFLFPDDEQTTERDRISSGSSSSDSVSEDPQLWVHQSSNLLRPIFRFLEIEKAAWPGLEETAASSPANHHIGAFMRVLSEEREDSSDESSKDKEHALSNGVDAMVQSMEPTRVDFNDKKEKQREYEQECREKFSTPELEEASDVANKKLLEEDHHVKPSSSIEQQEIDEKKTFEEVNMLGEHRKIAVLYELLSACLANLPGDDKKKSTPKKEGYDARHRVALRLLAIWLNVKWIKVEAIETMVACSAMALFKEAESNKDKNQSPKNKWEKWKRGGIIGAAALTGGTLLAITGGLAAPAIAAGFGALAPTLGTIIPVIGAGGFAAAATAAGSVVGSVAVAASFGAAGAGLSGVKMARRTGSVDEFEFKAIGENHNQGRLAVEILISGFVFEEDDFVRPWEGQVDKLERYALRWESKHLIAVSTAIQDYLTSTLALGLMKQGAMMTVLSSLLTAFAWPATLLMMTDLIDSKWTVAVNRSDKAGILLAEVLQKGLQGQRPVTLVGFSLGARVIFKCLQVLAESGHNDGLVERVVILGAPIPIMDENWEAARKVVAGRFVNAYSANDWMLGVAFRASLLTRGMAGIQPIDVPGIQNVDVTELIEGHSSYLWASQKILDELDMDNYYPVFSGTLFLK